MHLKEMVEKMVERNGTATVTIKPDSAGGGHSIGKCAITCKYVVQV